MSACSINKPKLLPQILSLHLPANLIPRMSSFRSSPSTRQNMPHASILHPQQCRVSLRSTITKGPNMSTLETSKYRHSKVSTKLDRYLTLKSKDRDVGREMSMRSPRASADCSKNTATYNTRRHTRTSGSASFANMRASLEASHMR